jgi:hypothetical protein
MVMVVRGWSDCDKGAEDKSGVVIKGEEVGERRAY